MKNGLNGVITDDPLARRRKPQRKDSRRTSDLILNAAAHLLQEVGLERLSTNLICKRAGITPPALYHYYPNKYAILFDLAHNLLVRQDQALIAWLEADGFSWTSSAEGYASLSRLQLAMRGVADAQTGAIWIIRAMRAIPKLREVRLVAHRAMVERLLCDLRVRCSSSSEAALFTPALLLGEILHLGTELELDDFDLDVATLRRCVSTALVAYIETLDDDEASRLAHPSFE